jgi:hypothetical protein
LPVDSDVPTDECWVVTSRNAPKGRLGKLIEEPINMKKHIRINMAIKKYDSVIVFGTTIHHDVRDGSDITEASMIEAVTSRIKDIFEHEYEGEFENAVELVDTCATGEPGYSKE